MKNKIKQKNHIQWLRKIIFFIIILSLILGSYILYFIETIEDSPSVFSIKDFPGFSPTRSEIFSQDGKLYLRTIDQYTEEITEKYIRTPSPEEWQEFNKSLLVSNACLWRKEYKAADVIMDGGSREINISFSNCKVQTTVMDGSTYPVTYNIFTESIEANLLGGKRIHEIGY